MARIQRVIGESGYYHIINRGNNKQVVYNDDEDYSIFLKLIKHYAKKNDIDVIAYCLMPNHFHLFIYDPQIKKSQFMQGLKITYTQLFNSKYDRIGSLFGGRYKCKAIDNAKYALEVFKYIHQNPLKSNISNIDNYCWSSYNEYFSPNTFIAIDRVRKIVGDIDNIKSMFTEQ